MSLIESFLKQIQQELFSAFTTSDLSFSRVVVSMAFTVLLSVYIFFIYRISNKTGFYSRNFNKTIAGMGVITGSIVLAMQTNVFVSLGMVGALSIVRFRNVVKDPYDLLFLFWSITTGIITGTGLYEVAILLAVVVTLLIWILDFVSLPKASSLLVIQAENQDAEDAILQTVRKYSKAHRVKSRNLTPSSMDMIIEVRPNNESGLIRDCMSLDGVRSVSLLEHDGEIRG